MFRRYEGVKEFLLIFAELLLRPLLAQDRLTHCKGVPRYESAKYPRFGPQKWHISKIWYYQQEDLRHDRLAARLYGMAEARARARASSPSIPTCVNSAAQFAGIAALQGPRDSVAGMRAEFDRRRTAVVRG